MLKSEKDGQKWMSRGGQSGMAERDGQKRMARKACPDGGPERRGIEDRQKRKPERRAKV